MGFADPRHIDASTSTESRPPVRMDASSYYPVGPPRQLPTLGKWEKTWPTAEGTGLRWLGRKAWGLVWLRWMRGRHVVKVKGWRTALVDDPRGQRSTMSPCFWWFD